MSYQALYRKYRPKNFDEVVGQKITIQILKNAIENGHISHAYLFYGPRGTGKTSIAKILARTINCIDPSKGIPCEKCDNCHASINPGCPDILEIDAASNNGVDEIRELKNKISFVPSELKYKVYIVDEVHMLSTGAFNALLKTLEEPPEHAIFILATTELQKVPLTIISRCQTLEFKKIDDLSMNNKLSEISKKENISIDESGIKEIIRYSNGGLRDAIGLLEKAVAYENKLINENTIKEISGNISEKELQEFIDEINNKNIDKLLLKINDYYQEGYDLIKLANNIIEYMRNKMLESKNYDKEICDMIIELDNTVNIMSKSENPKIIFEVTLINLLTDYNEKSNVSYETSNVNNNEVSQQKKEVIVNNKDKNNNKEIEQNIKEIRVGNTLSNPKKEIISQIRKEWDLIKDLAFDPDLGNISRILSSDINPVAASDTNVIIESKLAGLSAQINSEIESVEKIFTKTFKKDFKIICLSENEWKKYTEEFKKDKSKFSFKEEPVIEKSKKTLKDKAKELFDI